MNRVLIAPVLLLLGLAAVTSANLITTEVGPQASIYTAFFLIGFDLVVRDQLHDLYSGWRRAVILAALILLGSIVSYAINADAAQVAKASSIAFGAALTVDAVVYQLVRDHPWLERSNESNFVSSAVDSAVFVAIAFPGFLWSVAAGQFFAKVAGALVFSWLLYRLRLVVRPA